MYTEREETEEREKAHENNKKHLAPSHTSIWRFINPL